MITYSLTLWSNPVQDSIQMHRMLKRIHLTHHEYAHVLVITMSM